LFLAHMPPAARAALLDGLPLPRYTATTLVQRQALEDELAQIRRQGYAIDAEEFVDGLVCVAVPVQHSGSRLVRTAVALQAPAARMPLAQTLQHVPALLKAATALGRTFV
jgi:IclR family transcriptional regulator, acetate operon repressor